MKETCRMLRGYYIYYEALSGSPGVKKKVDGQVNVLNNISVCTKLVVTREKKNIIKSIFWRLPFGSFGWEHEKALKLIEGIPDYIYIRFIPIDRKFVRFIKTLRLIYPKVKILLEIPTYPYGKELLGQVTEFPFFCKDLLYRKKLKKYVDRIVTFSDDSYIWKVPTIHIRNGVQVNLMPSITNEKEDDTVVLIAVAVFQKSHGYERCIRGLSDYYADDEKRRVEVHFVGNGKELAKYKKLVKRYNLESYIFFHGIQKGKELERIYSRADIGLGALGLYKRKLNRVSTLKTPEYLSKGLPVIVGFKEEVFSIEPIRYVCEVPNDSSDIDINMIIKFYDDIYNSGMSRKEIREEIWEYAKRMVDLECVMQPVAEYLLN